MEVDEEEGWQAWRREAGRGQWERRKSRRGHLGRCEVDCQWLSHLLHLRCSKKILRRRSRERRWVIQEWLERG